MCLNGMPLYGALTSALLSASQLCVCAMRPTHLAASSSRQLIAAISAFAEVTPYLDASSAAAAAHVASDMRAADAYKAEGNRLFALKRYAHAIGCYSQSLLFAYSDRSLAAVLYTNRATCLFHLMHLEHALADCEHALTLNGAYEKAHARLAEVQFKRACYTQCIEAAARGQSEGDGTSH
jgi:tetratricopeptide (TPR) repeat protein